MLAQLATAALLVLTLVASFLLFGPGRIARQGDSPSLIPAISATPGPLVTSQTPIAEFLWQSDGGPEFRLGEPSHLTIDPQGNIWVPDGLEHRFLIYSPEGSILEAWGMPGSADGEFDFELGGIPAGAVGFDAAGNIYVVDSGNHRVQKFGPDRSFLLAWGSAGSGDGQFQFAVDMAIDGQGRVLVSDYGADAIQVFDSEGAWQATWGGYGSDPGELSGPTGITTDASDNLWVAEHGGSRVQKFSPDGESLMIWGGAGSTDQAFSSPTDVVVDEQGRVFISDRWNRVQVFTADGEILGS
jgi:sugar lactone lactonase YvrE